MSESQKGEKNHMYGHKYTKEELEKKSKNKWIAYNKNGISEIIKVMSIWCKEKGISRNTVKRSILTGKFCKKGWRIEKII